MQVPRLFAVLFAYVTFWRPKKVVDQLEDKIRLATFWCLFVILLEDKKSCMTFCRPFFSFGRQKVTKRTTKSRTTFFVPQFGQQPKKDSKKSPRSFWTAKSRPGEKDGKKSWHLHSPLQYNGFDFAFKAEEIVSLALFIFEGAVIANQATL